MVFKEDLGFPNTKMELPCGQCIGCRADKARQWQIRILHEAAMHESNCFITLTYAERENLDRTSLNKRDVTLFLKRLRKAHPDQTIRYFQCGEYGDELQRPHHHAVIFNYDFPDKHLFKKQGGNNIYLSPELADLWPHGQHSIGDVTHESAAYVAAYTLKKINGELAKEHYDDRIPEYSTMSRKPGLGKQFYQKFKTDIYNHDRVVLSGGTFARPPDFYDNIFQLEQPTEFKQLQKKRLEKAKANPDATPDRLAIRKQLHQLRQQEYEKKSYTRSLSKRKT